MQLPQLQQVLQPGQVHRLLAAPPAHLNAYFRPSQSNRTPYDVFEFLLGEGTAAKQHIAKIVPGEVVLKPRLVGIEVK